MSLDSWQRRTVENCLVGEVIAVWVEVRVEGAERDFSEVLMMLLICIEGQKSYIRPVIVFSITSTMLVAGKMLA